VRRVVFGAAVLVTVGPLGWVGFEVSQAGAQTAALGRVRAERPGVTWHVTTSQLYLAPYHVYDSTGRLRESQTGGFTAPRWVVELRGSDRSQIYDAIVDVSPVTRGVGGYQIGSEFKT
jgi:hypothetical protein